MYTQSVRKPYVNISNEWIPCGNHKSMKIEIAKLNQKSINQSNSSSALQKSAINMNVEY